MDKICLGIFFIRSSLGQTISADYIIHHPASQPEILTLLLLFANLQDLRRLLFGDFLQASTFLAIFMKLNSLDTN
jgi:hypothetical protein